MACDMLIMKLPMANTPRLPEHPTLRANRHVFVTLGLGMLLVSVARITRQSVIPLWAAGAATHEQRTDFAARSNGDRAR